MATDTESAHGLLREAAQLLVRVHHIAQGLEQYTDASLNETWCELGCAAGDLATRIQRQLDAGVPPVRVDVRGGLATLISKPEGVAVEIRDCDQRGVRPEYDEGQEKAQCYSSDDTGPEDELMV